ncbi:hypothetical protein B0J15DRAFT_405106, partial [Fusarium solani]
KGFFIKPIVFINIKDNIKIYYKEVFSPLVTISSFIIKEEATKHTNNIFYSLRAAIFIKNITYIYNIIKKIKARSKSTPSLCGVSINSKSLSGISRELGKARITAYITVKAVYVNLGNRL